MWFIPSRERPHKLKRLLAACRATGMSTPLTVVLDETEPLIVDYRALQCDLLIRPGESIGAADKLRHAFQMFPALAWYGFLPDDCEPQTTGWDVALSKACLPDRVAYCRDGRSDTVRHGMPVIGGDLLRRVGCWVPEGLHHFGGDRFWRRVAQGSGRAVHVDDHLVLLTDRVAGESSATWDAPKRRQKARQHEDKAVYRRLEASGFIDDVIRSVWA